MDKKYVFVTKYFILALKLFTVVFKEVTEVFRRMTLRVDLFVSCADIRSIRPLQFFVDFKLKSNWKKKNWKSRIDGYRRCKQYSLSSAEASCVVGRLGRREYESAQGTQ